MDIKERLMKGIDLRTETGEMFPITFKYEKLEILCYFCGCISHDIHYCNLRESYSLDLHKYGGSSRDIKNNFSFMMRANVLFNGAASSGPASVTISRSPRKPRSNQIPARNRGSLASRLWNGTRVLSSPPRAATVGKESSVRVWGTEERAPSVSEIRTDSSEDGDGVSVTIGNSNSKCGGLLSQDIVQNGKGQYQAQYNEAQGLRPKKSVGPESQRRAIVICVWCWHQIMDLAEKEDTEGRCPACRTLYDKEKIVGTASNGRLVAEINSERRLKSQKTKPKASDGRKHLSSVRVIQHNLVYIIGIPSDLADEELLQHKEYFGQYGKVQKVSIARTAGGAIQHSVNNTCSVYITYLREEEAVRCIQSVHGYVLDGKPLRACFGTTKYCHAWLRNMSCSNPDCLYLHEFGSQDDSFTKDETISDYTRYIFIAWATFLS
ncbi:hypothetical protein IFM89_021741 [Coptis chinensis]|uniref:RRM domain-containing protein n=1 Tax=Coptis chinensis TaxID=261450 RepID=A0A835H7W0_9MAGN|nr:hypothetical protein IFM89_021741 [Coptis chinensis]